MTAQEAIARSTSHNEIVTLDEYSEKNYEILLVECEDSTEANGVMEFWGADWRVHMPVRQEPA